jgi:hypothetical protein
MRRLTAAFLALAATACTNKLAETPAVSGRPAPSVTPTERGDLIGLTSAELTQRLGQPALQVREEGSLKLQFRAKSCVLDAYLYREDKADQSLRVVHVDSRDRDGRDADQRLCLVALQSR